MTPTLMKQYYFFVKWYYFSALLSFIIEIIILTIMAMDVFGYPFGILGPLYCRT